MKKLLTIVLSVALILLSMPTIFVSADYLKDGYFEYKIIDGYTTITDVSYDIEGDITIPSTLGGCVVKHIGNSAFSFSSDITSITLPSTIETIGAGAFAYCDFTTFTMPDSVVSVGDRAFENCDKLISISLSKNAKTLGEQTFFCCRKLKEINIPNSVTSIGRASFFYCDSLTNINVDKNNVNYSSIDGVLFNKQQTKLLQYPAYKPVTSYVIPSTVTAVGENAFHWCGILKSITIPSSVKKLEYCAFTWCYNLTDIVVPNSVTDIEDYVFSGCTRLKSIKLPDSITTINDGMFYECRGLTKFEIPNTVTTIGSAAFAECDELAEVIIPDSVIQIGYSAFKSSGLKRIDIPATVKLIGEDMFNNCTRLESINIHKDNANYCSVDGVMFDKSKTTLLHYPVGCKNNTYTVPTNVKIINDWAFYNCIYLKEIILPQGLEKIGSCAFAVCTQLEGINIPDSVVCVEDSVLDLTAYYNNSSNWENGVLYNGKHLIYTKSSISGDFTVKEGTKTIAAHAFYWRYNVENIIIPDSVVGIGTLAFGDNSNLKTVKIPASVVYIGDDIVKESPNAVLNVYEKSLAKDYAVENEIPYNEIKFINLENGNVKLAYYEDALSFEATLDVTTSQLSDRENEKKITAYDINLKNGDVTVQPDAMLTVYLPVSAEIDTKKCGVGYIDENGKIVKVGASYQDGNLVFDTNVLGTYVVFEKTYISGDVNDDGNLNNKDLALLMQSLNQWEVTINSLASDVNADGSVNNKDYALLMQYHNNWDVLLK